MYSYVFKIEFGNRINLHLGVEVKKIGKSRSYIKLLYKCYAIEKNIRMCRQKSQERMFLMAFLYITWNNVTLH